MCVGWGSSVSKSISKNKHDVTFEYTERTRNVGLKILKYVHSAFHSCLPCFFCYTHLTCRARCVAAGIVTGIRAGWSRSLLPAVQRDFAFLRTVQVAPAARIPLCSVGTGCSFLLRKTAGLEAE
jgi:hypothetical protein